MCAVQAYLEEPLSLAPPSLLSLELRYMELTTLPLMLTTTFMGLEELRLSWNNFTRLPAGLTKLTALSKLDLSHNRTLQLDGDDIQIVALLPSLQTLDLTKEQVHYCWSNDSKTVMCDIRARFPRLTLLH